MKLYYLLGRLLGPLAALGLHVYSYLTGTKRVRLVVQNENREILLVQNWLGRGRWGLPGGGVEKEEHSKAAAIRELKEETGITVSSPSLNYVATFQMAGHQEEVFAITVPKSKLPSEIPAKFEIKEAAWFSLHTLPPVEPLAQRILDEVVTNR